MPEPLGSGKKIVDSCLAPSLVMRKGLYVTGYSACALAWTKKFSGPRHMSEWITGLMCQSSDAVFLMTMDLVSSSLTLAANSRTSPSGFWAMHMPLRFRRRSSPSAILHRI